MTDINLPMERITGKIFMLRGMKVMLDRDLAELYGVETRILKQAVRRNSERFPDDFMFELSQEEFKNWRSQFVISNSDKMVTLSSYGIHRARRSHALCLTANGQFK